MGFKTKTGVVTVVAAFLLVVAAGCDAGHRGDEVPRAAETTAHRYERIISLSPSITETLFALGLGDRVAGVTRFCTYPPEAAEKPSVGGYLDPNYEMMVRLEPDLVLLLPEHEEVREYLDRLGIHHETAGNRTVADIMATIDSLGVWCDAAAQADSLTVWIEARMDAVRAGIPRGPRPRVLISVGRNIGAGTLRDVYVAGAGTSYDELIVMAGGTNAYIEDAIAYPLMTAEGLLHLDPDIIVDLVPEFDPRVHDHDTLIAEWSGAARVSAVRNGAVHLVTGDYAVVPGPRFIDFLEELAAFIRTDARDD